MEQKISKSKTFSKLQSLKKNLSAMIYTYLTVDDYKSISQLRIKNFYQYILANVNQVKLKIFRKYISECNFNSLISEEEYEAFLIKTLKIDKIANFNDLWASMTGSNTQYLPLYAYRTNGGYSRGNFDEFEHHFSNLFHLHPARFYSSADQKFRNVEVSAFLAPHLNPKLNGKIFGNYPEDKYSLLNIFEFDFVDSLDCSNAIFTYINKPNNAKLFQNPFIGFQEGSSGGKNKKGSNKNKINNNNDSCLYSKTSAERILENDILAIHHKPEENIFCINKLYLCNLGKYDQPATSLAFFIQDSEELNADDNQLLRLIQLIKNVEALRKVVKEMSYGVDYDENIGDYKSFRPYDELLTTLKITEDEDKDLTIVEFDTVRQRIFGRNLKLMMWISGKDLIGINSIIDLSPFNHYGKIFTVKFLERKEVVSYTSNLDFKTILAFGNILKLK